MAQLGAIHRIATINFRTVDFASIFPTTTQTLLTALSSTVLSAIFKFSSYYSLAPSTILIGLSSGFKQHVVKIRSEHHLNLRVYHHSTFYHKNGNFGGSPPLHPFTNLLAPPLFFCWLNPHWMICPFPSWMFPSFYRFFSHSSGQPSQFLLANARIFRISDV